MLVECLQGQPNTHARTEGKQKGTKKKKEEVEVRYHSSANDRCRRETEAMSRASCRSLGKFNAERVGEGGDPRDNSRAGRINNASNNNVYNKLTDINLRVGERTCVRGYVQMMQGRRQVKQTYVQFASQLAITTALDEDPFIY
jgi:hypothetical protein